MQYTIVTASTTFTTFFTVCTRNDAFLRLFKNEADVEEVGVVNLNLVMECSKLDVRLDKNGEEHSEVDHQMWRSSGEGVGDDDAGAEGSAEDGTRMVFRFLLTEVSGKQHLRVCECQGEGRMGTATCTCA